MTNSSPVLQFKNVSHSYSGNISALTEVNFTIHANEAIAICGHNGSGKTTLLKLAAGLMHPTNGSIELFGEPLTTHNRREAFKKIGFLFQDSEDQLFCPTVYEDVSYGVINMGISGTALEERVGHAIHTMGIEHIMHRPIHHLSGGEKKRVALAGLIAMESPILVMDEPTNGLDPQGSHELISLIQDLKTNHNFTIVVITHRIDTIPEFADRILILNQGSLVRDGESHEILTDIELLKEVHLETPEITHYFYDLQKNGLYPKDAPLPVSLEEALTFAQKIGAH